MSHDDVQFETFEFEADAWAFLYESGFVARLDNHREFDHPDGRWAVVIPATMTTLRRKSRSSCLLGGAKSLRSA
jgi:hypothetical protein